MSRKRIFSIKNIGAVTVIPAALVFALAGCGEKKEKAAQTAGETAPAVSAPAPQQAQMPMMAAPGQKPEGHPPVDASDVAKHQVAHAGLKGQKEVKLTDAVKAKWKQAKLKVFDKVSNKESVVEIKVGSSADMGKDGFKLKLEAVVPDYAMSNDSIISRSNEAKNPAVLLTLYSGDKAVTKGWVFNALPDFNSFKSDRFSVALESPGIKLK